MGLDIEWRDSNGKVLGLCVDEMFVLAETAEHAKGRPGEFPVIQRIDLYRDTELPLGTGVMQEFERLRNDEQNPERRAHLSKVVSFIRTAESRGTGLLRFLGD